MGHYRFYKFDRNIVKEDLRSFLGGRQENRELGSRGSNIAKKKLSKCHEEILEVEKKVITVGLMKLQKFEG